MNFRGILRHKFWLLFPQTVLLPDLISMQMYNYLHGGAGAHDGHSHDHQGYVNPFGTHVVLFANPFGDAIRYVTSHAKQALSRSPSSEQIVNVLPQPKRRPLAPESALLVEQVIRQFDLPEGTIVDKYVGDTNSMIAGYKVHLDRTTGLPAVSAQTGILTLSDHDDEIYSVAKQFLDQGYDRFVMKRKLILGDIHEEMKVEEIVEKVRFVLGHEVAHIKNKDAFRSDVAYMGTLGFAATVHSSVLGLLPVLPSPVSVFLRGMLMLMSGSAITLGRLSCSRTMELEADQLAMQTLHKSHRGAEAHFQYRHFYSKGRQLPDFLSTHPSLRLRMHHARSIQSAES